MLAETTLAELRTPEAHIVSEHGSFSGCGGGACIDHAHLSVLPTHHKQVIGPGAPDREADTMTTLLEAIDQPYLMLGTGRHLGLHLQPGVPSQFVRREYCRLQGRDDWDWGIFPADDVVAATVTKWAQDGRRPD